VDAPEPHRFDDVVQDSPFRPQMPWPEVHEPPPARAFLQHRRLSDMADMDLQFWIMLVMLVAALGTFLVLLR